MTEDLTCRELTDSLTDLIEGTLDADAEARIRGHLTECPGCQRYLDQLEQTIALVRSGSAEGSEVIPDALISDLTEAFRASRSR